VLEYAKQDSYAVAQLLPPGRTVRFSHFILDLRTRELRKDGLRVSLQEHPFLILRALLERPGELVTRAELQKSIWPSDTFVDFEKGLNNGVKRLPDVLCDSADAPTYVETLTGQGYRFIAQILAQPDREKEPLSPGKPDFSLAQKKLARMRTLAIISFGFRGNGCDVFDSQRRLASRPPVRSACRDILGRSDRLVTQVYFAGEELNDTDRILATAGRHQECLIAPFTRSSVSQKADWLEGVWGIVLDGG
jgi:DNA-binding winged helix-turn-helix (wHTH) protein